MRVVHVPSVTPTSALLSGSFGVTRRSPPQLLDVLVVSVL
jgi:hypothetical protein